MAPVIRGDSLYTIVDGPSWTQAEANSVKLGGHLASITTSTEYDFIGNEFSNYRYKSSGTLPSDFPNALKLWIGLYDSGSPVGAVGGSRNWKWSSGERYDFVAPASETLSSNTGEKYVWSNFNIPSWVTGGISTNGFWQDAPNTDADVNQGIAETTFIRRGDSAYVIVQGPTWEEAEANAVKLGGHLVTINDAAESSWLGNEFSQSKYQYSDDNSWWAPNEWSINHFWTGGKRVNNQWGWSSGENFDQSLYSLYLNNSEDSAYNRLLGIFNNPNHTANIYLDDSRDTYPVNPSTRLLGIAEIKLSTPPPTYTLTPSSASINEGLTLTTIVATTDVASGTTLYYSLSGTGINSSDFLSGALTGSGSVGSNGSFSFSHTLANDLTTEGTETLNIKLFSDSSRSTQVGSTASVSIVDSSITPVPTYSIGTVSVINEGSTLTTTVATTNVASGTTLYYALNGTGITTADFSSGAPTGSGSVASNGSFSFSHILANDLTTEGTETLNIKLFSDSARSTQVGSTASVSIADTSITPAPTAAVFSITGTTITEGDVAGVVISRSGNTTFPVTLNVTTSNGTATAGSDYNAINQNLIFNIGETTKTVTIPTISDSDVESDETFFANISSSTANTSIATSSAGITISNDDFRTNTTFSLSDLTVEEGKTGTATITRSGDISFTHVVALSTQNDTATSGSDYSSYSNSVTYTPGQSSITVSLATIDDVDYEGNEAFYLVGGTISGGSNNSATWVTNRAKVNILDNDVEIKPLIDAGAFATLSVAPGTLPQYLMSGTNLDLYYLYVEQYPLTLRTAFYNEYLAGRFTNEALYGQNHWVNYGQAEGRSLPDPTATTLVDSNDYGAYVENYGSTLLDIYRKDARAVINGGAMSLFAWGKEHYTNWGKAEGREISGGVDWGSIIRNNLNLYNQWQDARLITPTLSAFAYGFRNQNSITSTLNVKIGSDTQDKITGSIVYGLNANDVLVGTSGGDILSGGFGDDLIVGVNGGSDIVYGGPGRDVFQLNSGTTLNIRDFRKGADLVQLGGSLASSGVTMQWDSADNSTYFYQGASILAKVFGRRPTEFSYADSSSGISKVYI